MDYTTMTDEELRLEVAKRKGWFEETSTITSPTRDGKEFTYESTYWVGPGGFDTPPDWPTDIAAAWGLVEEMQAKPYEYYFEIAMTPAIPYKGSPCWHVEVGGLRAHAPTAPRAICIAWLLWKDAQG